MEEESAFKLIQVLTESGSLRLCDWGPWFLPGYLSGTLSALGVCLQFFSTRLLMDNSQHDYCCFLQVSGNEVFRLLPLQPAGENVLLLEDSGLTRNISLLPYNITESQLLPTLNRTGLYKGNGHWRSPWNSAYLNYIDRAISNQQCLPTRSSRSHLKVSHINII